jgi:anti-sigma regulatory factor (Ser/Thr protein kinase)
VEESAQEHAERVLAAVAAVSRLAALVFAGTAAATDGMDHTGRAVLLGLVTVESAVVAGACVRAGAVRARWVVADAAVLAGLMWLGTQPAVGDSAAPWRGLYNFATIAVVVCGLPGWSVGAALGVAALPALANLSVAFQPHPDYPLWNAVLDSLALLGSTTVVWVIGWLLRGSARGLDAYRTAALRRAEVLASERERSRQGRALRAQVLSTLEDVAALGLAPPVGEQVDREVRWLRDVVATGLPEEDGNLAAGLRSLVVEKAAGGLRVDLRVAADLPALAAGRTGALLGAAREALTNVAKHAAASTAEVRVRASEGGVEVVVTDSGRGYDPARARAGSGVRGSIRERMAEVGGTATVESAAGRGTRVRLWAPGGDVP